MTYSQQTIREIAEDRGLQLDDAQLTGVDGFLRALSDGLSELRAQPLAFIGSDIRLPTDVLAWIEGYATSSGESEEPGDAS